MGVAPFYSVPRLMECGSEVVNPVSCRPKRLIFTPVFFRLDPEVIKIFSCSAQLGMEFFLLINVKMPTIVGILTCMSGIYSILGLPEPKKV